MKEEEKINERNTYNYKVCGTAKNTYDRSTFEQQTYDHSAFPRFMECLMKFEKKERKEREKNEYNKRKTQSFSSSSTNQPTNQPASQTNHIFEKINTHHVG
jgi:hypothetical protein